VWEPDLSGRTVGSSGRHWRRTLRAALVQVGIRRNLEATRRALNLAHWCSLYTINTQRSYSPGYIPGYECPIWVRMGLRG
jgi:hypothetical protein